MPVGVVPLKSRGMSDQVQGMGGKRLDLERFFGAQVFRFGTGF